MKVMVSGYAPAAGARRGLGARWPALYTGHYQVTLSALCSPHNVSSSSSGFHTQHVTHRHNNSFSQLCCFYLLNLIDVWYTFKSSSILYAPHLFTVFTLHLRLLSICTSTQPVNIYVQIDNVDILSSCQSAASCVSQPIEPGPCAGWASHHLECVIIITLIIASLSSSLSSSRRPPCTHDTRYPDTIWWPCTPSYLNYLNYPPIIPNYRRGKKPNSFESQIFCWRC